MYNIILEMLASGACSTMCTRILMLLKPPYLRNERTKVQNPRRSLAASKCSSVYTVFWYLQMRIANYACTEV